MAPHRTAKSSEGTSSGGTNYVAPSPSRSRIMAAVKRSDTKPELALRHTLHAAGYRYRKDHPIRVEGRVIRPDIVFIGPRVAVFVDGCFWHCCPEHGGLPATNLDFWAPKLGANVERDRLQDRLLAGAGWLVVRVWEHEPAPAAAITVRTALAVRRSAD
jgi:DNA mismatch endonuclease (patch repair protein)